MLCLFQQSYLKAIRQFPGPLKRMDLGMWGVMFSEYELGMLLFQL